MNIFTCSFRILSIFRWKIFNLNDNFQENYTLKMNENFSIVLMIEMWSRVAMNVSKQVERSDYHLRVTFQTYADMGYCQTKV